MNFMSHNMFNPPLYFPGNIQKITNNRFHKKKNVMIDSHIFLFMKAFELF